MIRDTTIPRNIGLLTWSLHTIVAANFSLQKGFELAGNHLFAKWRETISEDTTFKVIKLMLDNSGKIAINPLLMLNEVLVIPLYVDALCTCHTLRHLP